MAGSVTGFYLGNLSDRFGRRAITIAGCIGSITAVGAFSYWQSSRLPSVIKV